MSQAPRRAADSRRDRLEHWIAAAGSAGLHALCLLLAMLAPPIQVTTPQGSAAGSTVVVDFVGVTPPAPIPAVRPTPPRRSAAAARATSRVQTTRVARADEPESTNTDDTADALEASRNPAPGPPPPPTPSRRAHVRGQPPGMLPEPRAPAHAGRANSPAVEQGRRNDASSSEPSLDVGGYQVYYEQRSETKLRQWREQGITEIYLPLPGTRDYMVCPLEIALRRESGPCRLLSPDSPEMADIGDAREVITMHQVYRRGELVWRGPGAYR